MRERTGRNDRILDVGIVLSKHRNCEQIAFQRKDQGWGTSSLIGIAAWKLSSLVYVSFWNNVPNLCLTAFISQHCKLPYSWSYQYIYHWNFNLNVLFISICKKKEFKNTAISMKNVRVLMPATLILLRYLSHTWVAQRHDNIHTLILVVLQVCRSFATPSLTYYF